MSDTAWTASKLNGLSYRDLQSLAQQHGIKANLKKADLVSKLTSKLISNRNLPKNQTPLATANNNEFMEVDMPPSAPEPSTNLNETFSIDDKITNSTFILEAADNGQEKNDHLFLSADESIIAGNINQTLTNDKENSTRAKKNAVKSTTPAQKPSRSTASRSGSSNRFAESHKRLFDKMEAIDDAHRRKLSAKQTNASNSALNRLATPKRFQSPKTMNFNFGGVPAEQIESVQKPLPPLSERSPRPVRRSINRQPQTDVKALTTQNKRNTKIPVIIPTDRISQLAIPKSARSVPISKERRSYTPNKSPYRYKDTSRMSNAEFRAYQREQKQEKNRLNKVVIN